jgi:hypothetical protein
MPGHFESELPTPDFGEEEMRFLQRCMSDARMVAMFPDKMQRAAVSRGQWLKGSEETEDHPQAIVGGEQSPRMFIPASVQWQF